jgi:hypothetical protein
MEHLRQNDPPRIGPYATLARVDSERERPRTPDRRFIARSADGRRTVMICVPHVEADPTHWAIEAEAARRHCLPLFLPVTEVGDSAACPWYATPYVPRLTLAAALAAHGRPLPEAVVRSLGAALATALATAHAQGVTHAGLSPAAVLLGADGPRLSCFGAVRAAAPDGEKRTGAPGLDPSCLAPEQAQGGRPRPLGDVYALGAVLSYACTGYTVPEREELPASLRGPITDCLSHDPVKRPSAAELVAELTPPLADPSGLLMEAATGWTPDTPTPTVLDGSAAPAPTVLDGSAAPSGLDVRSAFPLPAGVVAALARQSAQVLVTQLPQRLAGTG